VDQNLEMSVTQKMQIVVNGRSMNVDVEERTLLVQLLRDQLHLTGTHVGCDTAQCGACTVHMNGLAIKSCSILALQAQNSLITTIEGLAGEERLDRVQQAFHECHGLQCGFCTPGMVMSACHLLARNPKPTEEQVRVALEGNICRCTGYQNIVSSVVLASERG
jgi:aerobic carbon-monoxide dehydrogenase small subunit